MTLTKRYWDSWWDCLPLRIRDMLRSLPDIYPPFADLAAGRSGVRCHDRPMQGLDAARLPFPWRFAHLAGRPLSEYTVKHARHHLSETEVIVPDWQFPEVPEESLPALWRRNWAFLTEKSRPMTSAMESDLRLFLHRRPWLSQVHARTRQENTRQPGDDSDDLEESTDPSSRSPEDAEDELASDASEDDVARALSAGLDRLGDNAMHRHQSVHSGPSLPLPADTLDDDGDLPPALVPAPQDRALEEDIPVAPFPLLYSALRNREEDDQDLARDHRLGPCPSCQAPDSAAHGFIECELIQRIWLEAMPLLTRLAGQLPSHLVFTVSDVVLCWPSLQHRMPGHICSRLNLWRASVISVITQRRHQAIASTVHSPVRTRATYHGFAGSLEKVLVGCLVEKFATLSTENQRKRFVHLWIEGGTLLRRAGNKLIAF